MISQGSTLEMHNSRQHVSWISHWSAQQRDSASDPALAFQRRAISRLSNMVKYLEDHQAPYEEAKSGEDVGQLTEHERDIAALLDETHQFGSDENVLAILNHTSNCNLRRATNILQQAGWSPNQKMHLQDNPLKANYALALQGYSEGVTLAMRPKDSPPERSLAVWVRMLQAAGDEHSVSPQALLESFCY